MSKGVEAVLMNEILLASARLLQPFFIGRLRHFDAEAEAEAEACSAKTYLLYLCKQHETSS